MLKKTVSELRTLMSVQMKSNEELVVVWTNTDKKVCVFKRIRILSY